MSKDIAAIGRIAVVPVILEVICKSTGLGFAAVARVTTDRWVACSVRDEIKFGLKPGGELPIDTTLCHEIHQTGDSVVIDHVAEDEVYRNHHTPAQYGFQSYISVPIIQENGYFFGTLCAIDPKPALLNTPEIIGLFKLYAHLISLHLDKIAQLPAAEAKAFEENVASALNTHLTAIAGHVMPATAAATPQAGQVAMDIRSKHFAHIIRESSAKVQQLIDKLVAPPTAS